MHGLISSCVISFVGRERARLKQLVLETFSDHLIMLVRLEDVTPNLQVRQLGGKH